MHGDRISMELPILYFKVKNSNYGAFVMKISFYLCKHADPDEMPHYATLFHLGLHSLPKYPKWQGII